MPRESCLKALVKLVNDRHVEATTLRRLLGQDLLLRGSGLGFGLI